MDVSVLHLIKSPDRDYTWKDKLNSLTGHLDCRFLEWTGWYNQDIHQRLLGHYRLYQVFKAENNSANHVSIPLAYIVNYRASHLVKYLLSGITASVYYIFTFGERYSPLQIESINKVLINDKAIILQKFLHYADKDFSSALAKAVEQIASPDFLNKTDYNLTLVQQNKNEYKYNRYESSTHYFNEYNTVEAAVNSRSGKEKGVFSKKQILILFDLLAEAGKMEKIDFSKPNKFEFIADLLNAITGKSKDSWIGQLKDYRSKDLYEFKNEGELNQLIITLTNLSETFRKAGFRFVANIADKKLRELDKLKSKM